MEILYKDLTEKIIGLIIEVHKELGPGLLEKTYQLCLAYELNKAKLNFQMEIELPVIYKNTKIDCGYKLDMLVEDKVIIELKCVEKLMPVHEAQILTYLKLCNKKIGLLINFNECFVKDGIKRFIL